MSQVLGKSGGVGAHQSPRMVGDVWLTPPYIVQALGGWQSFDLDPCAAWPRPWPCARARCDLRHDGLKQPWRGRVFMNPPYGQPKIVGPWMRKMVEHGHGTALIFARTETALFHETVWNAADAVLFLEGRLFFYFPDGDASAACLGQPIASPAHDWVEKAEAVSGLKAPLGCRHCGISKANSGGPSVLVAYGEDDARRLQASGLPGAFIDGWRRKT